MERVRETVSERGRKRGRERKGDGERGGRERFKISLKLLKYNPHL